MKRLAIVGGSGASWFAPPDAVERELPATRWGTPSAHLLVWQRNGTEVLFLRRHGAGGRIPPHRVNYRANVAALAAAGATDVIALNAVGSIRADWPPPALVLPAQLIDYTWGRAHSYYDELDSKTEFIDFTRPYDERLRNSLIQVARRDGLQLEAGGVYGVTQGPRLETAAEIDRLERDGCDLVGMTALPEAALMREAGLACVGVAIIINRAAGRGTEPIHAEIESCLRQGIQAAARLVDGFLAIA